MGVIDVADPKLRAVLEDLPIHSSGRDGASVWDLIVGYEYEVRRFASPTPSQLGVDAEWGADDYIGTLHARWRLASELERLEGVVCRGAEELVGIVDAQLIGMTDEIDDDRVRRWHGDLDAPGWWWQRVPKTGVARVELDGA